MNQSKTTAKLTEQILRHTTNTPSFGRHHTVKTVTNQFVLVQRTERNRREIIGGQVRMRIDHAVMQQRVTEKVVDV